MISPRQRLLRIRWRLVWRPAATKRQLIAAVVAMVLGFGSVAAWRAAHSDEALSSARPDQLLALLDSLNSRQERLQAEQRELALTKQRLQSGSNAEAIAQARTRLAALEVLSGTRAAVGPGLTMVISDPDEIIPASLLLDTIQELRDAGAEAIQIGRVRVVASTWFADRPAGGITVSGATLTPPFTVAAIGDPSTMRTALGIPGGVKDSITAAGGSVRISIGRKIVVSAVVSR